VNNPPKIMNAKYALKNAGAQRFRVDSKTNPRRGMTESTIRSS